MTVKTWNAHVAAFGENVKSAWDALNDGRHESARRAMNLAKSQLSRALAKAQTKEQQRANRNMAFALSTLEGTLSRKTPHAQLAREIVEALAQPRQEKK